MEIPIGDFILKTHRGRVFTWTWERFQVNDLIGVCWHRRGTPVILGDYNFRWVIMFIQLTIKRGAGCIRKSLNRLIFRMRK